MVRGTLHGHQMTNKVSKLMGLHFPTLVGCFEAKLWQHQSWGVWLIITL